MQAAARSERARATKIVAAFIERIVSGKAGGGLGD
jgi:hypothetical protein